MENEKELDLLFGEMDSQLNELKQIDPDNEQISTHSMNNKTVIETIKERVEEFKEYNGLTNDFISNKNSENALPDELGGQGIPISTKSTEGIHDADETDNEELISSHNSDNALPHIDTPVTDTEKIDIISDVNSSKFVP